ncbi:MAG: superfamily II helicase [Thermoproteota archaeon]|jgi:superfamily II helicase
MSLKDALEKAGVKSTKSQNDREQKAVKVKNKSEKNQEHRNFCEVCEFVQPDVERFVHKKPTVDAEWICSNCADKVEVLDEFRVTHQSDFARRGRYRRQYGPTKDFGDKKKFKNKSSKGNEQPKPAESTYTVDDDGEKNFNC